MDFGSFQQLTDRVATTFCHEKRSLTVLQSLEHPWCGASSYNQWTSPEIGLHCV
jgi:hypothetical protein